jgi:hypothetical protein
MHQQGKSIQDDGEWMDNMTDIIAIAVAACLAVRKENNER